MSVAHFGLAMFILGATTVESYKQETDLSLQPGQSAEVAGFTFTMTQPARRRRSELRGGRERGRDHARRQAGRRRCIRRSASIACRRTPMTEAGIDAGWNRDLFVAMGEPLGDGAWSLRLQYKPMVRFIWLGALVIAHRRPDRRVRSTLSPARHRRSDAVRRRPAPRRHESRCMWRYLIPVGLFAALARVLVSSASAATRRRCRRR